MSFLLSARDVIPDSVEYQYPVSTFGSSTWTDNVGSADMAVNNLTTSTFSNNEDSVSGGGADDYGTANIEFGSRLTSGIAFTFQASGLGAGDTFFGQWDADLDRFTVRSGDQSAGSIEVYIRNGSRIIATTDNTYDDGTPHAVVINKSGDAATDLDIYVDDMSTPVSTTYEDDGFDSTNAVVDVDMAFYALNDEGTINNYTNMHAGVFEFNSQTYSETERQDFVSRRPEV